MDSGARASRPVRQGDGEASWPVRLGAVPPLAEHFSARPETAPDLTAALVPGTATVLVPGQALAEGPDGWPGSCGKTQLAVSFAKSLWRSAGVDLLVWVAATSRASVLAAKQFAGAITVLSRVVGDYERVRGAGHADTLDAQDELATAYLAAGQYPDAVLLLRRTLTTRDGVQGPENLDVMTTRHKLADACLADGRLKEALAEYKRTLTGRERVLGGGHPDTVAARVSLGTAYLAAGRMAAAIQLYEQARAGYVKALGADHRESLACSAKLAEAYHAVGRVSGAMTLLRDTLPRCERALPPGDALTEAVREWLTSIAAE